MTIIVIEGTERGPIAECGPALVLPGFEDVAVGGDEGSTILFAMVAEPARRSLTITSGHACTCEFETFSLDD